MNTEMSLHAVQQIPPAPGTCDLPSVSRSQILPEMTSLYVEANCMYILISNTGSIQHMGVHRQWNNNTISTSKTSHIRW
jgi:hypothetical protein